MLGVDPGLEQTGYGVVAVSGNSVDYLDCGVIRTDRKDSMPVRLLGIADGLGDVLSEHRPSHAVIEQVFVNKNPASSLKLGSARGAAVAAVGQAGATIYELSPKEIKRSITGQGGATKGLVGTMVKSILGLHDDFNPGEDALDALACAICFRLSTKVSFAAKRAAQADGQPA